MTHEELKRELRDMKRQLRTMEQLLNTLVCRVETNPLMTMQAAAQRLHCSYRQLQKIVNDGAIGCTLVGKRKMFTEENIREYLRGK